MRELFNHLDWGAIAMACVFAYAAPILLACVTPPSLWSFAFWLASPIAAGYLAAHFAREIPLFHGLVVGVVSIFFVSLISSPHPVAFWLCWFPITVFCSIYGAQLWRKRQQRS